VGIVIKSNIKASPQAFDIDNENGGL